MWCRMAVQSAPRDLVIIETTDNAIIDWPRVIRTGMLTTGMVRADEMRTRSEARKPGPHVLVAQAAVALALFAAGCGLSEAAMATPVTTPPNTGITGPRSGHPSRALGSEAALYVFDPSGEYAAGGVVDIRTDKTTVDIAGSGFEPAEKIMLTVESGEGSTTLSTSAAVEGNLIGAFSVTGVVLPSSVKTGDVLTVKAAGDKGTVAIRALVLVNKNATN